MGRPFRGPDGRRPDPAPSSTVQAARRGMASQRTPVAERALARSIALHCYREAPRIEPLSSLGSRVFRLRFSEGCKILKLARAADSDSLRKEATLIDRLGPQRVPVPSIEHRDLEAAGVYLVVAQLDVRYKRPARYDDVLVLRTTVQDGGHVKIEHTYELLRGEELLAVASTTLACVNAEGRPQPAPDFCRI